MSPSLQQLAQRAMLVLMLTTGGCAGVTLMSGYDQSTDQQVTALQKTIDDSLGAIAAESPPACLYAPHAAFYQQLHSAIHTVLIRNTARAQNSITTQQVALLDSAIITLEALHKISSNKTPPMCIDAVVFSTDRVALDQIFVSILKLELAKKRPTS